MTAPAMKMAGKTIGGNKDVPLVLLHGFGGTMGTWASVVPLIEGEMPLVLVDLPGHGESLGAEGAGGAGRMAKAILAGLSARGIEIFHLAGHSMGGAVAALMAMRDPARVKSLALVAPGGMAPEINAELLAAYAAARTPEELRAYLEKMAAPGAHWPEGYFEDMSAARSAPGALEAIAQTYAAMFPEGPEKGQGVLPREHLAGLSMPAFVLWGEADTVLPCPKVSVLPENLSLTILPGAGHMLPEERPLDVAEVLRTSRIAGSS